MLSRTNRRSFSPRKRGPKSSRMDPGWGRYIAGVIIDVRVVADDLGYARVVHSLVEAPVRSLPDSIGRDTYPIVSI